MQPSLLRFPAFPLPAGPDRRHPRKALVLVALLVAAFAVNLDTTIVNVALPSLVRQLHATTTQLQWVVDAYNLVFAALILTAGSLSDRFGRKGMLLGGLAVFGVGGLAAAAVTTADQLIVSRAVMGLGAAMVFPATLSLLTNVFVERRERAQAIGLWGATSGAAVALGPIVGGWLLEHFSWPAIFLALVPVAGAGALLVAVSVIPSRDPRPRPIDAVGFLLSVCAMGVATYTLIEAPTYGWTAGRTVGGLLLAGVLTAVFLGWERRRAAPMLDLRLFSNARFSAASASVTVAFFTLFGFIFLMTQYFQFVKGYSPLVAGVRLLPVATAVGVASVLGTRLAVRLGTKQVVVTGLVCVTAFYLWVAATLTETTGYGTIAAQMVLFGVGMGLTSAPATESIMGAVGRLRAGVGSALNDATRLLGGTLGVAVLGSVYASVYASHLDQHLPRVLPRVAATAARQSVGGALAVAHRASALGHPAAGLQVHQAATGAFLDGLSLACAVAAGVAAVGAALAFAFLPTQPVTESSPETSAGVCVPTYAGPVPALSDR